MNEGWRSAANKSVLMGALLVPSPDTLSPLPCVELVDATVIGLFVLRAIG